MSGGDTKLRKKPRPADVSRAKGYVDRVKALIEQQKEIGADISDVCTEAKQVAGLDPTTIRFAARSAKRAERDDRRAQYLHAVGLAVAAVESGELSARQAAKVYRIGKTSIYKEFAVREVSATDHRDMTAEDIGKPSDGGDGLSREMVADDLGDPLWITDKDRARFREKVRAAAASVKVSALGPVLSNAPPDNDLAIPSFLDRRAQVTA